MRRMIRCYLERKESVCRLSSMKFSRRLSPMGRSTKLFGNCNFSLSSLGIGCRVFRRSKSLFPSNNYVGGSTTCLHELNGASSIGWKTFIKLTACKMLVLWNHFDPYQNLEAVDEVFTVETLALLFLLVYIILYIWRPTDNRSIVVLDRLGLAIHRPSPLTCTRPRHRRKQ